MTLNFPGPYELRIFYDTTVGSTVIPHEQRLNVKCQSDPSPGALFSAINIVAGDNTVSDLQTEVDAWVALMKALFHTSSNINYAELWKYTPGTFLASFISTYNIAVAGTSGSATASATASIFVFRTIEGGLMKVQVMEGVRAATTRLAAAGLNASEAALVAYVLDPALGQFFLGRDTSYPFAFTYMYPGQHEALWKKRFRTN